MRRKSTLTEIGAKLMLLSFIGAIVHVGAMDLAAGIKSIADEWSAMNGRMNDRMNDMRLSGWWAIAGWPI